MATFTGSLNSNELFAGLYNMIISQTVFADNLTGLDNGFVSQFKVDGSLYGDTKLYYSADVLESVAWVQDQTSPIDFTNLLATHRPEAPDVQAITLNKFRQIALTVDNYMSKRAWATEGAFAEFNSVMLGMISETKAVYDYTTLATYVGTAKSAETEQNITVTPGTGVSDAQAITNAIANLMIQLQRPTRKYNDFKNMRAYAPSTMKIVWNAKYVNQIKAIDEPMLRQLGNIIAPDMSNVLAPEYFGTVKTTAGTTASSNTNIRSLVEKDYEITVSGKTEKVHVFPGDLLPDSTAYLANEVYEVADKVICKVMHANSVPFMSAFEVGTSFFNARNLSENHYLTWGHNTLEYLKQYPYITVSHS